MNPKEKAEALIKRYIDAGSRSVEQAKAFARICCDELMQNNRFAIDALFWSEVQSHCV